MSEEAGEEAGDGSFCARATLSPEGWAALNGYGECRVTSLHDGSGIWTRLHIDRADPRILITGELAEGWKACGGDFLPWNPFLAFRPGPEVSPVLADGPEGWLVTIQGDDRTVIYRIGKYLPGLDCYEAEWPD